MTLVTAACGGQDISVGALAAIAGSVYVKIITGAGAAAGGGTVLAAFLASMAVAMIFGAFNGTLVAVFKIQPDDCHAHSLHLRPFRGLLDQRRRDAHRGLFRWSAPSAALFRGFRSPRRCLSSSCAA